MSYAADLLAEVDDLVADWMNLPDVAEHLGEKLPAVRKLLQDHQLVALRRGDPPVLSVPTALVEPTLLPGLAGTWVLLADCGFSDLEALRWLFSPDPDSGGTPVQELRAGRRREIRRRAQALAF